MKTLLIAEHNNQSLSAVNENVASCASQIGADTDLLIVGHNCQPAVSAGAKLSGLAQVLYIDAAHLEHQLAEDVAPLVVDIIKEGGYSHVLVAATTSGKNLLPRVAALLDVQPISDITTVISADTYKRPIYAGNSIATVKLLDKIHCISVRAAAFQPCTYADTPTPSKDIACTRPPQTLSNFARDELVVSERPDLSTAKVVFSGGRGMASAENFDMLYRLADLTGGAVGASRAAVDAGFVSNDMQVGQTGKIIAPQLYVAVGISGAIQHLAGMKESKTIVAINKDEDAPIFQVADYGLVADLFDALPKLEAMIKK